MCSSDLYLRDARFPRSLEHLRRLEVLLSSWSQRSAENARRAKDRLFGVQNGRKARGGMLTGLLDPGLMRQKKAAEELLRQSVAARPELQSAQGAWDDIRAAQQAIARDAAPYDLLEGGQAFDSTLFHIARTLLRGAEEKTIPSGKRLREFRESNRESLELELFSEEPLYDDFEALRLGDSLTWLCEKLGVTHSLVQQILAGKSPSARAAELIGGTRLKDVALRKRLYAGSAAEVAATGDPMIELARLVDAEARRLRKALEAQDELKRQAYAKIAAARFALQKDLTFPDATFTLRLAFGAVKGYEENGQAVPFQTTFAGLYERAAEHAFQPGQQAAPSLARRHPAQAAERDTPFPAKPGVRLAARG